MKYFLIHILLLPCIVAAQANSNLTIDSLPVNGVLLDRQWKYKNGDNPGWAAPGPTPAGWKSIDPNQPVELIPGIDKDSILWLRINFIIPVNDKENYALMIEQSGATQIFFNGELIKTYGVVWGAGENIIAFNPLNKPLPFFPVKDSIQTIAVRYCFQPGIQYRSVFNTQYPLFSARIAKNGNAVNIYSSHRSAIVEGFNVGVYLVFFLIHLIFYLFYPVSKSNLYYCLWGLFLTLGNIYLVKQYQSNFLSDRNFNAQVVIYSFLVGNLSLVYSMFLLLKQKTWLLMILIAAASVFNVFVTLYGSPANWQMISFVLNMVAPVLVLAIAINAVRQKVNGSYIIISGAIAYMVFWTIFTICLLHGASRNMMDISFHLAAFVLPVSMSLVLGMEFRYVNKSLVQKLMEVETLSVEKQQILAAQNETLEQQVKARTAELSTSLKDLKAAQSQLIQSEKMASLGELTAGIAHEIQNPLNFVNNFSEINNELIEELKSQKGKSKNDRDEILENELINDIAQNSEKINQHGKRADAIVKGMLQHSRRNTGQKEPADINKLADEYLRLSYHGLRAKDKNFNAMLETDFDPSVQQVNMMSQDIGRVLLNLFNNAFYAVGEKSKSIANGQQPAASYQPTVSVSTKKIGDKVEIKVSDNGNGIPQNIIDKIFQPFFTTKPTGQGTGLGLSLSYDIVTKAHHGSLEVYSKEGEGTHFVIHLPVE